jgi:2-oxoglutarate ferredoxin oxidoreductase subunit beta
MTETKHFETNFENKWCPGCGNFGILNAMKKALSGLSLQPKDFLIVSGIGQAAKTPHFIQCNMFHGLHGRALPVATGAKIANSQLTVLVNSGDGDCYGEGGNHFLHAIRRNIDITLLVHNNKIYGLTKGQASPTTDPGTKTRIQPDGVISDMFNPLTAALIMGAGYVARGYSGEIDHLSRLIRDGVEHRGFSLIDILQPCVSFNPVNTFQFYNERVYRLDEDGYEPTDRMTALGKAEEWGERIPIGLFYRKQSAHFTERIPALGNQPLFSAAYDPGELNRQLKALFI